MIVAALPVITAPVAVSAASAALDRWRLDGEDRVIRQFVIEFRGLWSVRTTLGTGVPMAAAVLGLTEIRHFAPQASAGGRAGLCLAAMALFITLAALGYVLQLTVDKPGSAPLELWSLSARLAVRNLLVAGPLSAIPVGGVVILAGRDPAVLLLGLPVFLLHALKLTATTGLRRAGPDTTSASSAKPTAARSRRPSMPSGRPAGSLSTYTIRASAAARCAIWWVLSAVGRPRMVLQRDVRRPRREQRGQDLLNVPCSAEFGGGARFGTRGRRRLR
jgi:hypothetical protein